MSSLPRNFQMGANQPAPVERGRPFIIGVSGGTASGKTTVCRKILEGLEDAGILHTGRVTIMTLDSFYRPLSDETLEDVGNYNFDHPDAFDFPMVTSMLQDLAKRKAVDVPEYDFCTHSRTDNPTRVYPCDVIMFEGILAFYTEGLRELMDLKIFVDTDADVRLSRRILRDIRERGRTLESVLDQYNKFVKPSFDDYISPTKKHADVIVPRGASNSKAIHLLIEHIKGKLDSFVFNPEEAAAVQKGFLVKN